jgi:predicted PurR-regulated permease PerM
MKADLNEHNTEDADPGLQEFTATESTEVREDAVPRQMSDARWQRIQAGAQTGLFFLALLYTAHVGASVLKPLVVAALLFLLLHPIVRWLTKAGVRAGLAASLVVGVLLSAIGFAGYKLSVPATEWSEQIPRALRQIRDELRGVERPVEKVSQMAEEAEKLVDMGTGRTKQEVVVEEPGLADSLWASLQSFFFGGALAIVFLVFLLVYGERSLQKLFVFLLPNTRPDALAEIPTAIEHRVSAYLGAFCLENIGLALAATLLFWLLGVPSPALWGCLGGLLNFVPYLGAITTSAIVGLVAYASADDIWRALTVGGSYLMLSSIEGTLIQPVVLGRRLSLNPIVMLLFVTLGTWLWGIVGALVAVPCLVVVKTVCDQVSALKPLGSLLT